MIVRVLDALRKQRNLSDDDGDLVTEVQLRACIEQVQGVMALAERMLAIAATRSRSQ